MCINYAHRGASLYAPENTFAAFEMGIQMGADGIETDIQRTRDGVLALHHDKDLSRTAGATGRICDYTYEELLAMDFGSYKASDYRGERIVTLEQFLDRYAARPLQFALEIKQEGIEQEVLCVINRFPCRSRITVTSFSRASVSQVRDADADIAVGFLTDRITEEILDDLEAEDIRQICPRAALLRHEDVEYAHRRGFSVRAFGVRDTQLMLRVLDAGADGMTVDFPDKLAAVLKKRQI